MLGLRIPSCELMRCSTVTAARTEYDLRSREATRETARSFSRASGSAAHGSRSSNLLSDICAFRGARRVARGNGGQIVTGRGKNFRPESLAPVEGTHSLTGKAACGATITRMPSGYGRSGTRSRTVWGRSSRIWNCLMIGRIGMSFLRR